MIWGNGKFIDDSKSTVGTTNNRGFLLGEGVFETLLSVDGAPTDWEAHLARIRAAADYFAIPVSVLPERADAEKLAVLNDYAVGRATLRLTASRSGGRGLMPAEVGRPLWLMQMSVAPPPAPSLKVVTVDIIRNTGSPTSCYKTLSYLDNITARRRAVERGANEALLFNVHGRLACAAAGNVFVRLDGCWRTPPVREGAFPGIVREKILQTSGGEVIEQTVDSEELRRADAMCITNSLIGIAPVITVDKRRLVVERDAFVVKQ